MREKPLEHELELPWLTLLGKLAAHGALPLVVSGKRARHAGEQRPRVDGALVAPQHVEVAVSPGGRGLAHAYDRGHAPRGRMLGKLACLRHVDRPLLERLCGHVG